MTRASVQETDVSLKTQLPHLMLQSVSSANVVKKKKKKKGGKCRM